MDQVHAEVVLFGGADGSHSHKIHQVSARKTEFHSNPSDTGNLQVILKNNQLMLFGGVGLGCKVVGCISKEVLVVNLALQ